MSGVVDAIEASFKNLIREKPFRSVTVKEICEGAYISRRTFYANFVDKRAVIAYLFRRDAVEPMRRVLELLPADELKGIAPSLLCCFYEGIYREREFYSCLVKPMLGVDATFELVVARAMQKVIEDAVTRHCPGIDSKQLYYFAYYHASAQAIFLEKWINENCEPAPAVLAEYHAAIIVPSFASLAGLR